jgi:hypothetical protein
MAQGCSAHDEYNAFSGGTPTVHAVYSNATGGTVVQCGTVLLGGNGVFN